MRLRSHWNESHTEYRVYVSSKTSNSDLLLARGPNRIRTLGKARRVLQGLTNAAARRQLS